MLVGILQIGVTYSGIEERERNDVYRGSCLMTRNCRGDTAGSVKITWDVEEKYIMFENLALMWP